ncbi:MAG: tRNA 2-thiocytidine(32) synthetase TtcA [Eubacterium sp.]|nr:tRNA 2-thiocytidine(32) synthetase TtcA [Eubacterium sp.]
MDLKRLLSYVRRAVDDYQLLEEGDKVAVGISGGKDSLALLYALKNLQRFYPKHFTLTAITVHLGFEELCLEPVQALCQELQVPYEVVPTEIQKIVFQHRKPSNPCSLCAKLRKGALNDAALKQGCNKVAYGHHRDDLIETMLLSLFFEGRFHSFSPKTEWERTGLTLIRPLLYVPEADLSGFQNKYQLPVIQNPCPADGHTSRQEIKNLLRTLSQDYRGIKDRMFKAILSASFDDWP